MLIVTLAPFCAACERPLASPSSGPVCDRCWQSISPLRHPLCHTCGDPLASWRPVSQALQRCARCRRQPPLVARSRAAGEYDGSLRAIVHALKYDGRRTLARTLGTLMCAAGADVLEDAHCVVPVPLHAGRRLRRGFNQAGDLARTLDLPVVHALWRRRATTAQSGLTASARRRNVRGAFRLSPLLSRRARTRTITDRIVVLVDDVRTTGATLDACASVLLAAGAAEVRALTAARADLMRPKAGARRQ